VFPMVPAGLSNDQIVLPPSQSDRTALLVGNQQAGPR
jgi:hypothetical protein